MTIRRRNPALAIAAALFVSATAVPALAGEVTGNGKLTPGGDNAASICAFSGLNDHPLGGGGDFPGKIQNFAHFMFFMEALLGINLGPHDLPWPGVSCHGNANGGE